MFKSKLIVFAVALCSVFSTKAQILCGVEADFVWDLNPNNVPVFTDTSGVAEGWAQELLKAGKSSATSGTLAMEVLLHSKIVNRMFSRMLEYLRYVLR